MYKLAAIIIIAFSAKYATAQDGITKSNWADIPVKVDGNANEWKQPLRFYDTDTKLSFSFLNDSTNLYLCFEAPDESNQMKIIRAGMKVSLSIKGKDKHKVSIAYPLAQKAPASPEENSENHEQRFARTNMHNSFFVQNTMMEVKGFTDKDGDISIKDSSGINVAVNWDSTGNLFYEIAIPLKEFLGADYSTDLVKEISMEATVNAIEKHNNSGEAGGGRSGGGGGGFHGGGGGGHMGGGGGRMGGGGGGGRQRSNEDSNTPGTTSADRMAMFTKSSLKQKFVLTLAK